MEFLKPTISNLYKLIDKCEDLFEPLRPVINYLRAQFYGEVLQKQQELNIKKQNECTHKQGGYCLLDDKGNFTGAIGPGIADTYAVMKHKHSWGDIWVRCLRCGKHGNLQ